MQRIYRLTISLILAIQIFFQPIIICRNTDYNISQGEALGEAILLYEGARSIGTAAA